MKIIKYSKREIQINKLISLKIKYHSILIMSITNIYENPSKLVNHTNINKDKIQEYFDDENELVDVIFTKDLLDYVKSIGLVNGKDYFLD